MRSTAYKFARLALSATLLLSVQFSVAAADTAAAPETYTNPIIPGFFPDPSIIRVGEDYYLANSSFEWFPAVPLFHSKDLVNWQPIGHAITNPDYLPLIKVGKSRGIYAPTLREHKGTFYMITTCVQCGDNFYVTAKDPRGPWSKPIWIKGAKGIDPDLFWDDDGKAYYSGAGILDKATAPWKDANGIWQSEIDLKTGTLIGEKRQLTHGHATNARWTEGPHIYKINGRYMLMTAEGGTGMDHAITVFESKDVTGPYVPHHKNPVLTHRNLGKNYPLNSTGHPDLVQTQNGEWYGVALAKRNFQGFEMLARETFLVPVTMEDGWPVFNPGHGKILDVDKRPNLPWTPFPKLPARDEFTDKQLRFEYNQLRNPASTWYALKGGQLIMDVRPESAAKDLVNPSMLVRRIQHHHYSASTKLRFNAAKPTEIAGLVVYRDYSNFYQLVKNNNSISLSYVRKDKVTEVATIPYTDKTVVMRVDSDGLKMQFSVGADESSLQPIGESITSTITSDNVANGFHGPYVGMYTSSQGEPSKLKASFDWFEYQPK